MTTRQRLSWEDREASAHPATPDEGPASPAYAGADPEVDDYKNGDTSSWAEDVHPGPYPESAHPATPDEGPASPAYKAAAMNRKAAKCIRIATSMLGDPEGDADKVAAIEDQALVLMNLDDGAITASLKRLGEDVEEEEEEEESKKASSKYAAQVGSNTQRIARLERILIRLAEDDKDDDEDDDEEDSSGDVEKKDDKEESKKAMMDDESMLEAMLEEEGMSAPSDDSLLEAMLEEEGMLGEPMIDEPVLDAPMGDDDLLESMLEEEGMVEEDACGEEACGEEACGEPMEAELDIDLSAEDPMGVMDTELDVDESMILASLYGDKEAGDEKEEDEDEEESKKASQRPQPKKASAGARKLGGPVSKQASDEVSELEKLWESAPDVSKHF
jgi:hypothetical protein